MNLCPSCSYANRADATVCHACGFALVVRCPHCAARNSATSPTCRECGTALAPDEAEQLRPPEAPADVSATSRAPVDAGQLPRLSLTDALWIDDVARPGRVGHTFSSEGPTLNLLDLDIFDARQGVPPSPSSQPELIRSDPEPVFPAPIAADPSAVESTQGVEAATLPGSAASTSKANRRAAVRRARMAAQVPVVGATAGPPDVLVLDENDAARAELCGLLEAFGFKAHPARDPAEARALLASHGFVAVFLAVVLDGTDSDAAADLCLHIQQASAQPSGRTTALVIVGSGAQPVERVRASMAGADQFLVRPASRGSVARALDACGVALPSDPRRV